MNEDLLMHNQILEEHMMSNQMRERQMQYVRALKSCSNSTTLKSSIIAATGRFLERTGNKLLEIA